MTRSFRSAVIAVVITPAILAGQTVHGTVTDGRSSAALPGVVVTLLDANGAAVARALSNERGEYRVTAPGAGAYRLRALRIGFRPVSTSEFTLAAGADALHPLLLAPILVALDTFRVTSRNNCEVRPDTARATFQIWEQVRAALTATEITGRDRALGARVIVYERTLEPNREIVVSQFARSREGQTRQPWMALSEDSLRQFGYVQQRADGTVHYYAPDLHVLLSDGFLEDHCLRLSEESDASRIGIEFEPIKDRRRIPEIRGTVWLDRRTAEARQVEFRYVNVPREQAWGRAGAEMRFVRIANGAWMIAGWHIRMPVLESRVPFNASGYTGRETHVKEIRVEGGELALATRGSDTLWSRPAIPLRGSIVDSTSGAAWSNALVTVRGTELETRSDSAGRFVIPDVLPGEYTLEFATPELEAAGVAHREWFMLLDSTSLLAVRAPPAALIARSACGADTAGAMIVGLVRDRAGRGVRDARVLAEWLKFYSTAVAATRTWVAAQTNRQGRYVLCGVPAQREVDLRVESDSGGAEPVTIRAAEGVPRRIDFEIGARARSATLSGKVLSAVDSRPIPEVEIVLPELARSAITNADGAFRMYDIPPGRHEFVARRVGYRAHVDTLAFGAGRVVEMTAVLSPVPTLDPVDVTASARIPSFEEHRAIGLGYFMTRADLETFGTRQLRSVLAQVPKGEVVGGNGSRAVIMSKRLSSRAIIVPGREPEGYACGGDGYPCGCYAQVYVDNTLMNPGDPTPPYNVNEWSAERVEAIEWYAGLADTPIKYLSKQKVLCGVLVIHTRRYDPKP